jgi:hypothetical protein
VFKYLVTHFQKPKGDTSMTANPHLIPQLDAYLAQSEPGFAIMIDAPWGAGKTHAIKAWLNGKPHCYVSLFGVASIQDIEEALFNRLMERQDIKPPNGFNQIAEGMTKKFTGVTIDLTGFHRQQVMKSLPKLLIFDDLERAQMPPPALLAALNRFVEHEGRQVILIANENELGKGDDYRKWREKVVGRTITLKPETDSALDQSLAALAVGDPKDFLTMHSDLIIAVFQRSETGNLRLLRQSVTEFAALYAMLPDYIRNKASGMKYLVASFLALSIAYHAGQITKDDLLQPMTLRLKSSQKTNGEESPPSQLQVLEDRFKDYGAVQFRGNALPGDLARMLIGDGYAPQELVVGVLCDLAIFRNHDDEPWVTLAYWRHRDEADVKAALDIVRAQLDRNEITAPSIILHLWGIFKYLAKHSIGHATEKEVDQRIQSYIAELEEKELLPETYSKSYWNSPFLKESAHGLGYAYQETPEFEEIRDYLISALDRVYRAGNGQRITDLLKLVATNEDGFAQAISGIGDQKDIPNFSQEAVFSDANPVDVANALFSLPPKKMLAALRPFEDRMMRLTANASVRAERDNTIVVASEHPERIFLKKMRDEALKIADDAALIRAAQIREAVRWQLGFLDPAPLETPPDS